MATADRSHHNKGPNVNPIPLTCRKTAATSKITPKDNANPQIAAGDWCIYS